MPKPVAISLVPAPASSSSSSSRAVSLAPGMMQARIPASEFTIPSADSRGQSARIGTRVPPAYLHQIEVLLQSKRFPWETPSDFMRWALHAGIARASDLVDDPRLDNTRAQVAAMLAVVQEEEEHTNFSTIIDRVDKMVSDLLQARAQAPAKRAIIKLLDAARHIQDPYWRGRYEKEVLRRFGGVMATGRAERAEKHNAKTKAGAKAGARPRR